MVKITIEASGIFDDKDKTFTHSIEDSCLTMSLTMDDFYKLCKKLAYVYGYHENTIKEYFREEI